MVAPASIKPSPAKQNTAAMDQSPAPATNMLPLILGASGAAAFLLVALIVVAVAFWPASEEVEFADAGGNGNGVGINDLHVQVSEDDGTINTNNINSDIPATNPPTDNGQATGGETAGGNAPAIDEGTVVAPPAQVGGTRPPKASGGTVEMDAQFLLGTLGDGEEVLSDRDFVWRNVASELKGLDATRWQYGPLTTFKIKPERNGPLYLIVPPLEFADAAPEISLIGWEVTALSCDVEVEPGTLLPCRVYRRTGQMRNEITIAASATAWPIVATGTINKRTRILGDIVNSDDPAAGQPPATNPVTGGNTRPPNTRPPVTRPPQTDPDAEVRPTKKPPEAVAAAPKIKVPTNDVQKPIRTKLAELYNIDSLKSPDEKLAAAKNLLDVAREPSENSEERYVMLATSAQLAADAGDLLTALLAVETIDIDYAGDVSAMKLHLARLFAKSNVPANVKVQQLAEVLPIIDEGLANDHFDAIDELVKELLAAKLRHPELAGRRKIALDMQDTYRKVTAARKTLQTSPNDAAANRVVGEYYCYYKLDWEQGLPYLAKADDAAIQKAAELDASSPESGADQLAVADKWYNVAKELDAKTNERQKGSLLARAQEWYERASPDLKGLDEAHAKKRLDEVQGELVKLGWVDVPRKAVIVATSGIMFECYLNGEQLFSGSYDVESTQTTLKRGDILMFHATKSISSLSSYSKGFACVIAFEGAQPVATGLSKGWQGFVPSDSFNWYRPEGAKATPVMASSGVGHTDLMQQTGVPARSLWYAAGNTSEAYFFYRVK